MKSSTRSVTVRYILFAVQILSAIILLGAIADQARYGPTSNVCLLYISNYHVEAGGYVFWARSGACTNLIALGSAGFVVSSILLGLTFWFRNSDRSKSVILASALLATLMAIITFSGALAAAIGLKQTCREFESSGATTCDAMFSTGFYYRDDNSIKYVRNLTTVFAGVVASWIMLASWVAFSAIEWYSWRYDQTKWW